MVEILIICVGKNKEKYYQEAAAEYIKRLSALCRVCVIEIPEYKLKSDPFDREIELALIDEGIRIKKYLKKEQHIISLCIEGEKFSSSAFAHELSSLLLSGKSKLAFIIGGSFGLSDEIKRCSDIRLSLSDMTLPHHLARVVLLEQIYRAFSIIEGS